MIDMHRTDMATQTTFIVHETSDKPERTIATIRGGFITVPEDTTIKIGGSTYVVVAHELKLFTMSAELIHYCIEGD